MSYSAFPACFIYRKCFSIRCRKKGFMSYKVRLLDACNGYKYLFSLVVLCLSFQVIISSKFRLNMYTSQFQRRVRMLRRLYMINRIARIGAKMAAIGTSIGWGGPSITRGRIREHSTLCCVNELKN